MWGELFFAVGTLIAIVNPFSTVAIFNGLMKGKTKEVRKATAYKAISLATIILFSSLLIGKYFLAFFGITLYAFQVVGGLMLAAVALQMMAKKPKKPEYQEEDGDVAIIPLAIPLQAGPGSIATVMVMGDTSVVNAALAIILVGIISLAMLYWSRSLKKIFTPSTTGTLQKLLSLVVLTIAVQFLFNGITGYLQSLGVV